MGQHQLFPLYHTEDFCLSLRHMFGEEEIIS